MEKIQDDVNAAFESENVSIPRLVINNLSLVRNFGDRVVLRTLGLRQRKKEDGTITRKYGGSGLGLARCKQLIDMMGGTINVKS